MEFIEKHKALIITALLTGIIVLALFSLHLTKESEFITETYYELQPEKTPEEILMEQLALNDQNFEETNKAFNEAEEFKEVMKNFKSLNSNDFDRNAKQTESENEEIPEEVAEEESKPNNSEPSIDEEKLTSFSKINEVIAKRSAEKRESAKSNGDNSSEKIGINDNSIRNSSVSYSLKGRDDEFLPPPVYLCEEGGKIVINIKVNANGDVVDAYVNTSSSSSNQCLIDNALDYAQNARFSADASKAEQIGSITYFFKRKY